MPAGALDAPERIARPVENTLYFAGEHTDTSGHWGIGSSRNRIASGASSAERGSSLVGVAVLESQRTTGRTSPWRIGLQRNRGRCLESNSKLNKYKFADVVQSQTV